MWLKHIKRQHHRTERVKINRSRTSKWWNWYTPKKHYRNTKPWCRLRTLLQIKTRETTKGGKRGNPYGVKRFQKDNRKHRYWRKLWDSKSTRRGLSYSSKIKPTEIKEISSTNKLVKNTLGKINNRIQEKRNWYNIRKQKKKEKNTLWINSV